MNNNKVKIEEVMITKMQANKLAKIADLRKPFNDIEEFDRGEINFDLIDGTMVFMTVRGRVYTYDPKTNTQTTVA